MTETKIFTDKVEESAIEQINKLSTFPAYSNNHIRIMPDCHAGAGCTIGTTMLIKDKITPNLVGVDIGCGMLTVKLKNKSLDLQSINRTISEKIPDGFYVHKKPQTEFDFSTLRCAEHIKLQKGQLSLGTLGGGNHFIEIAKDENSNDLYLIIHTGSRNIGLQVAKYYQKIAEKDWSVKETRELAYLEGFDFDDYMNDMKLMQEYSSLNRRTIANILLENSNMSEDNSFETIHNYIDFDRMVLRKGAIRAEDDELILIPMNMRDGSLLCRGKGNEDWNYSAPHGAGRLMSRTKAKKELDFHEFKDQMQGIYTTSVKMTTLDEAPNAYKPKEDIINYISDTAEIITTLKPILNFKSH